MKVLKETPMRHNGLKFAGSVFAFLFCLWAGGYVWFACSAAFARPTGLHKKTDAIVVLTGGGGRILTGLRLFAAARGGALFISGVNPSVKIEDIIHMWDETTPLPPCCITLGYEADDTNGNALETARWVRDNKIHSIRLVTASYHMTRSLMLFRRAMPEVDILPFPVYPDGFRAWHSPFWEIIWREYHKTLLTWAHLTFKELPT